MTHLPKVLKDIARPAPNEWNAITDADFAKKFDYIIQRHGSRTIVDPVSKAATEWLNHALGQDLDRFGTRAWILKTDETLTLFDRMAQDGLVSDEEWEFSMNCEDRDKHAGEDR